MFTTVTLFILFVPMPLLVLFSLLSIFKQPNNKKKKPSSTEESEN